MEFHEFLLVKLSLLAALLASCTIALVHATGHRHVWLTEQGFGVATAAAVPPRPLEDPKKREEKRGRQRQLGFMQLNSAEQSRFTSTFQHAVQAGHKGDYLEAVEAYEVVNRIFPAYIESHTNLATCLERIGEDERAIEVLRTAVKRFPGEFQPVDNLCTILLRRQDEQAELLCTVALKLAGFQPAQVQETAKLKLQLSSTINNASARTEQASTALSNGEPPPETAEEERVRTLGLMKLSQVDQNRMKTAFQAALQLGAEGNYPEAIKQYEIVNSLYPAYVESHTNLATCLERIGDDERAKRVLQGAITRFPHHFQPVDNLCTILIRQRRMEALPSCALALKLSKSETKPWPKKIQASSELKYATLLTEFMKYDEAAEHYEAGLALSPHDSDIMFNYAASLTRGRKYAEALEISMQAMRYYPKDARHISNTANIRLNHIRHDALSVEQMRQSNAIQVGELHARLLVPLAQSRQHLAKALCKDPKMVTLSTLEEIISHPRVIGTARLEPSLLAPSAVRQNYGHEGALPCKQHRPLTFSEADITVMELDGALLEGESGVVHDGCSFFPLHHNTSEGRWIEAKGDQQPVPDPFMHIKGTVLTVVQHNPGNHYHWLVEVLARLLAAKAYLQKHPSPSGSVWDDVQILLPSFLSPVQEQTLRLVLSSKEIKRVHYYKFAPRGSYMRKAVLVEKLLTVVWRRMNAPIHESDGWAVFYPPRVVLRHLRDVFFKALKMTLHKPVEQAGQPPAVFHVVYVSRANAGVRKVSSEKKLLRLLDQVMSEAVANATIAKALITVDYGNTTLRKQAEVFAKADIVLGPHGAGLTNILFCKPQTHIVLMPLAPDCLDSSMPHLAAALDHVLWSAPWLTTDYYGEYSITNHRLTRLRELLKFVVTMKVQSNSQQANSNKVADFDGMLSALKTQINCTHFLRPVSKRI